MPDPYEAMARWAAGHWPGGEPGRLSAEPIAPDGSNRLFLRLQAGGKALVALGNPENPPENRAWLHIAGILSGLGVPAARVLAADLDKGFFLMEDLGGASLQEAALALSGDWERLEKLYAPVLAMLAAMQKNAAHKLDTSLCFDGPELTPDFLRHREAGYFLAEFAAPLAGPGAAKGKGLAAELDLICEKAGRAGPRGFVHRDFQSRNILTGPKGLGLVDFQGGRLGPCQYDLASLLHDPYVDLDWGLRDRLAERYLEIRFGREKAARDEFSAGWPYVCLSRVMQALGAYGFLTRKKGKRHFAPYIAPALRTLRRLLGPPPCREFRALGALTEKLQAEME